MRGRVHARRTLQKVPHKSVWIARKVPHKSVLICQKVLHKNVMCFAFSLIFSIFAAKNNTFPIRETKKQQTAKGLLLKIGVFPISFMGCVFFISLSQWVYTSFNTVSNLPMKSSTFSLVNTNGGRIRRMLVPAQPVKQCCSWMSLLRTSL